MKIVAAIVFVLARAVLLPAFVLALCVGGSYLFGDQAIGNGWSLLGTLFCYGLGVLVWGVGTLGLTGSLGFAVVVSVPMVLCCAMVYPAVGTWVLDARGTTTSCVIRSVTEVDTDTTMTFDNRLACAGAGPSELNGLNLGQAGEHVTITYDPVGHVAPVEGGRPSGGAVEFWIAVGALGATVLIGAAGATVDVVDRADRAG